MGNLTEKELSAIGDMLNAEELLIKKFQALAGATQDAALQSKLNGIASKHQEHFNMLYSQLS